MCLAVCHRSALPWAFNEVICTNIAHRVGAWLQARRDLRLVSSSARDASLARVRLVDSPPLRLISVSSPLSSSLGVLFLAATTGPAAAPFVTNSPGPLPARSIHQVCLPLLFHSAVRDGAPQTLTKLFVFGSESSYNILPTNFDFVCKNVHLCPMLGPPLLKYAL